MTGDKKGYSVVHCTAAPFPALLEIVISNGEARCKAAIHPTVVEGRNFFVTTTRTQKHVGEMFLRIYLATSTPTPTTTTTTTTINTGKNGWGGGGGFKTHAPVVVVRSVGQGKEVSKGLRHGQHLFRGKGLHLHQHQPLLLL